MQLIAAPAFAASPFFGQNIAMSGKKDLYCASAGGHVLNRNLSCALNHLSILEKVGIKKLIFHGIIKSALVISKQ